MPVTGREFSSVQFEWWHMPVLAYNVTFHRLQQAHWFYQNDGMCCLTVTSRGNYADIMCDLFCYHCQAWTWSWYLIGCNVFVFGGRTLRNNEAPHRLVFGDWSIIVANEVQRLAVFFNELPYLGIRFAWWPFSTVPSQVFWLKCIIQVPKSVWLIFPFHVLHEFGQLA